MALEVSELTERLCKFNCVPSSGHDRTANDGSCCATSSEISPFWIMPYVPVRDIEEASWVRTLSRLSSISRFQKGRSTAARAEPLVLQQRALK